MNAAALSPSRIAARFAALKAEGRAGLVTFIMGGDPDIAATRALLHALPAAGADVVELGMPFSDPMADGPSIQEAGNRALAASTKMAHLLDLAREFRAAHPATPLVLMGYYNPVYRYGPERFAKDAAEAGVDGMILVDLPPEEEEELTPHLRARGIALVRLITPTADDARLKLLCAHAAGFVYFVSVTGVTGVKSATRDTIAASLSQVRRHTSLPVAVGFGIKTPQQVKEAATVADAVVVGSALVDVFAKEGHDAALAFVRSLRAAL